jgi:hypothetical protein
MTLASRTMSRENVGAAVRSHDAFNRRDIDAFLVLADPMWSSALTG